VKCSGTPYKHKVGKTGTEFRISGGSDGWVHRKGKDGKWRPLTSHYFWDNNYGAQIVCEDLGFGKGFRTKTRNHQNRDNFDTETGNRRCASNNRNILECRKYGGPNQNDKSAMAHVKCSGVPWTPVYVRTGSVFRITKEGWVEIRHGGSWRPLTSHYFWDNNYGAQIVCENLGYAKGYRTKTRNYNNRELFDTATGYRRCASSNTNIF
jgi:hypothetical protein